MRLNSLYYYSFRFITFSSWYLVVVIGFPLEAVLNATEGVTTTVNVCPQLLEGTLERQVSVFATTSDVSARGGYHNCVMSSTSDIHEQLTCRPSDPPTTHEIIE